MWQSLKMVQTLGLLLCAFFWSSLQSNAAVRKDVLVQQTRRHVEKILIEALNKMPAQDLNRSAKESAKSAAPKANPPALNPNSNLNTAQTAAIVRAKLLQRAMQKADEMSQALMILPENEIDDDLAKWITDSTTAMIRNRANVLIIDSEYSNSLFSSLNSQILKHHSLTNARGSQLRQLSNQLLKSSDDYQKALLNHLARKFTQEEAFGIEADFVGRNQGFAQLPKAWPFKSVPKDAFQEYLVIQQESSDFRLNSQLLTLALMREIKFYLQGFDASTEFSYGNLWSKAFDEGDPLQVAKLEDITATTSDIDSLYRETFKKQNGVTTFSLTALQRFIFNVKVVLRYPPEVQQQHMGRSVTHTNAAPHYIVFSNFRGAWDNFALGKGTTVTAAKRD